MITLEQTRRLEQAGYKLGNSFTVEHFYDDHENAPICYTNDYSDLESAVKSGGDILDGLPSEENLMEWLRKKDPFLLISYLKRWVHKCNADSLTERLVSAVEIVLKNEKDKK